MLHFDFKSDPLNIVIGFLLAATGLGFIGLFLFLKFHGELSGDFKISIIMVSCGVGLVWISSHWLMPTKIQLSWFHNRDFYWPKLRLPAEIIACIGCIMMLLQAIAIFTDTGGLPDWLMAILIGTPIVLAWFVIRILVPDAFPSHVFSERAVLQMSGTIRFFANLLIGMGWLGYIGILFIWFNGDVLLPSYWRLPSKAIASGLVSFLFASQVVTLHYGQLRTTDRDN
jgi:hypothetical protein